MIKKFIFSIYFFLISYTLSAQDQLKEITYSFEQYKNKTIQEKIFIHSDRSLYLTGEDIWFKAYVVDAGNNHPIDLSKVIYIELLDENNKAVIRSKFKINEGSGSGNIYIPASVNSGNYILRAYTRCMENFDASYYFQKMVTVINPFKPLEPVKSETKITYDIQFFPEGGNLVNGVENKVAFRVVDKKGNGINFKGVILNEDRDTVAHFSPYKFGLGNFTFTPENNTKYSAVLYDDSNNPFAAKELPVALDRGYTMLLQDGSDNLKITVNSRPEGNNNVYLFIHTGNDVSYSGYQFMQNGKSDFVISKSLLKEGISHITIFDAFKNPVCERLYFTKPAKGMEISVKPDKNDYNTREKVNLDIELNKLQEDADLSISVFRKDSLIGNNDEDITSFLLLTSELNGAIESPSYYLGSNDSVSSATDNLMLTHGWRRFKWEDVQKGIFNYIILPEHKAQIVYAKVKSDRTGEPVPGIVTYLTIPGKIFHVNCAVSDDNGDVYFEVPDYLKSDKMYIQPDLSRDSMCKIELVSPYSTASGTIKIPTLQLSEAYRKSLEIRSINMQIRDIYITKKPIKVSDSTLFYGKPDEQYYLDDFTRFTVLEEVLREYVPGVFVKKRKGNFYFEVFDNQSKVAMEDHPLVLLDGMPLFNNDELMKYDPLKIQRLDVIGKPYFLKILKYPGIVSFATYKGDLADFPLSPHVRKFDFESLREKQEFFSPMYDTKEQKESHVPDFRDLLYWNPELRPDKNGKIHTEFYTSDQTGKYILVIQGLSKDGESGSAVSGFSVK